MNIELLNRLSNLTFYGFYDPSKDLITVHFFNESENKPDIMAYLKHDMDWDVREIVNEKSVLFDDREIVTISHNKLSLEGTGGAFDDFVRLGLNKMAKEAHGEDADLSKLDPMFKILENNKYE